MQAIGDTGGGGQNHCDTEGIEKEQEEILYCAKFWTVSKGDAGNLGIFKIKIYSWFTITQQGLSGVI